MNWDEVHKLLSISDLAHQWPKLSQLNHAAMRALEGHAAEAARENGEAEKKRKEEAEAKKAEAGPKDEAEEETKPRRRIMGEG